MTNITSAQSTWSEDNNTLAPDETPAESVSTPGQVEKTCSAVGLRRRLALQTNRTFIMFLDDTLSPWVGAKRYPSVPSVLGSVMGIASTFAHLATADGTLPPSYERTRPPLLSGVSASSRFAISPARSATSAIGMMMTWSALSLIIRLMGSVPSNKRKSVRYTTCGLFLP